MKTIDELTVEEAREFLHKIADVFGVGIKARHPSTLMVSIENVKRFSEYLHAVEHEFFMVPGEPDDDFPDDEPDHVCLVNSWGSTKDQYIEQFRKALEQINTQSNAQKES